LRNRLPAIFAVLFLSAGVARASVALLLEEPFGRFGGMNPTGHAAVYLSRICAASPTSLRRCREGEQGVVISRYHRVSRYDWIAIPLVPYLYAVDRADEVPATASAEQEAALRDAYRRMYLEDVAPDAEDGSAPKGDWIQLVGAAYDRTIYAFGIETTEEQDDRFMVAFNTRSNKSRFNLIFHNCADFARQAVDFYYPHSVHRNLFADIGIMTPKQAAKSLLSYSKRHRDLQFSSFVIPQVPGSLARSAPVRGVLESLVRSKRYAVPLVSLSVLHPLVGGSLAFAWLDDSRFNPRRMDDPATASSQPAVIAAELEFNQAMSSAATASVAKSGIAARN